MLNLLVRKATTRWPAYNVYNNLKAQKIEVPMSIYCQHSFMQTPSQNPFYSPFYGVDDAETDNDFSRKIDPVKFPSRPDPHPKKTLLHPKDLEVPKSPKRKYTIS